MERKVIFVNLHCLLSHPSILAEGDKSLKQLSKEMHLSETDHFWPDLTNSSTSPASHRNIQPLYCLWWDRVTVSLTDHARHKTAVTASPWDSESGVI